MRCQTLNMDAVIWQSCRCMDDEATTIAAVGNVVYTEEYDTLAVFFSNFCLEVNSKVQYRKKHHTGNVIGISWN